MGQVTIKDIARRLKLSPSTVSRALRDHPDISPATKDRIRALAVQIHYQPNNIAKSLQTRRSTTIGVIVPEIRYDFFANTISGIEEEAHRAGYSIIVAQSNERYQQEVRNTEAMIANRVAGLLVSVSQETNDAAHLESVIRQGIPMVLFDRTIDIPAAGKVVVDDHDGAYAAVAHCIRCGCRRIAHLAGSQCLSIGRHRRTGYEQALKDHGLPVDTRLVVAGGGQESDGRSGAKTLMDSTDPPDAIFAFNDPVAIGAHVYLKETGWRIPEDIALVGFSNNPVTALIEPPLTTVNQPAHEIGRTAAGLLLKQLEDNRTALTAEIRILKTDLIVRQSTCGHPNDFSEEKCHGGS